MGARRNFCSGEGGSPKKVPIKIKYKKGLPTAEILAKRPQYGEKVSKRPQINILLKYSYIFATEKVLRKCTPTHTKLHN